MNTESQPAAAGQRPLVHYRVISLDAQSPRCAGLLAQLAAEGVDARIFDAVDGRKATPALAGDEWLDTKAMKAYRPRPLNNAEIGCYLSHLRLATQALEEGIEWLCVLEDDVGLEPGFRVTVERLAGLGEPVEFVRLMGLKRHRRKLCHSLDDHYALTRPIKGTCGTLGYLINRQAMQKFLRYAMRIHKPIDKVFDHFWEWDLHSFAIEPHLIYEETGQTTILKQSNTRASTGMGRIEDMTYKLRQRRRSFARRTYQLRRWRAFSPATPACKTLGRTTRIR